MENRQLNIKYAVIQAFFFATFSAMFAFASVFLLNKGLSNTTIGLILSACSIISVVGQPMLASFVDDHPSIGIRKTIMTILAIVIVCSTVLYFNETKLLIIILVIASFASFQVMAPLMNSLAFIFEKDNIKINYGLARGIGSAAYAIASMGIGYLLKEVSPNVLPIVYVVLVASLFVAVYTYTLKSSSGEVYKKNVVKGSSKSVFALLSEYKKFSIFLIGVSLLFFAHAVINNFFIQVIRHVGGNSSDMGNAVFLAAIVELPLMTYFAKINEKVTIKNLFKISMVFFVVKHTLTYLARSMTLIYVAQFLQIGAYAVFIVAAVYYVKGMMSDEDMVKGQSLMTMSMSVSGVFGSLAGGFLIDRIGISSVLLISVIFSTIGAITIWLSVE